MTQLFSYRSPKASDEWLTPQWLVARLGNFDLDPCSPVMRPWPTARRHLTIEDDGLAQPWKGRVWLNPPYGKECTAWLEKLSLHGTGTALVFARTETQMFARFVYPLASSILFIRGRIQFCRVDGVPGDSANAPSCLIAYGAKDDVRLRESLIPGFYLPLGNLGIHNPGSLRCIEKQGLTG